jgi:O-antigen ligase
MGARARWYPLMPASVLALGAVLGVVAALQPLIAVVIAAGGVLAYFIFSDLALGFGILMFVAFFEVLPSSSALSPAKGVGLLLALAWLARFSLSGRGEHDFFADHPQLSWAMIAFIGWGAVTLIWAPQTSPGLTSLSQYVLVLLLLPIAYTAIRQARDLRVVLAAIVIGALIAACVGIVQPPDTEVIESTRATGTIGDPNEFAAALLVGLALASGFVISRGVSPPLRLLAGLAIPLCAAGMFLSASRGGLVSLAVMFLVGTVAAGRWRIAATSIVIAVAIGGVFYFTQLAPLPARERVLTANGGSGRTELWQVGLRIVRAHPFAGVGVGNFQSVSPEYVLQPGVLHHTSEFIFTTQPFPAHNAYLQVFAEMGIPGLVLFLGIIGASLSCALRAARVAERRGDVKLEALARAVFLALTGVLTSELFISQMHGKLLWGLLALGPAMLAIARAEPAEPVLAPSSGVRLAASGPLA